MTKTLNKAIGFWLSIPIVAFVASCGPTPQQAADMAENTTLRYAIQTSEGNPERVDTGTIVFRFVGNNTTASTEIVNCSTGIKVCFLFDKSVSYPLNYTSQGLTATISDAGDSSNLSLRSNNTAIAIGDTSIGVMTWHYGDNSQDRARADRRHSELLRHLRSVEAQLNAESAQQEAEALQALGAVVGVVNTVNNGNISTAAGGNPLGGGSLQHCMELTAQSVTNGQSLRWDNNCGENAWVYICRTNELPYSVNWPKCPSRGMPANAIRYSAPRGDFALTIESAAPHGYTEYPRLRWLAVKPN